MNQREDSSPSLTLFSRVADKYKGNNRLEMPEGDLSLPEMWRQLCSRLDMSDMELAAVVADLAGLEVAPALNNPQAELVSKVPYNIASTYRLIPFGRDNNTVLIAVGNPFDETMHEMISFIFGINTRCFVASPDALEVAITTAYEKMGGDIGKKQIALDEFQADQMIDRQVPRLARQLLKKALDKGASDLHVQDFVGGSAVRIRVDGILQRLVILPATVAAGLIRYFKALGAMDPTSMLRPQDGRVAVKLEDQDYDLRLSVIPTQGGKEKLVIRFLSRSKIYKLSSNSFSLEEIHTLRRLAASPSGVVLVCGPTGSGKTTTLYSILSELNDEQVSISTVENPVEYNMAGLAQTEINEKAGMTFASALRSILRQDPDIILIGEIRDSETAQIAMQSALTGHLVFSTLHTNDALSAIPRLMDLGIPTAILVEALVGVVSQRLLRRLCSHCKGPIEGKGSQIEEAFWSVTHVHPGARSNGCEKCNFTGYLGRVVVSEMFEIDAGLRKLIQQGESDLDKLHHAAGSHNKSLSISASRLIISGETSVEESVRIIGRHFWLELAEEYKTKVPDLSILNISGEDLLSDVQPAVLLAGPAEIFSERLKEEITHAWYDLLEAISPEEANSVLHEHEEIKFVILALDNTLDDGQCLEYVAEYRRNMAWSRLPALILFPEGREDLQAKLVADGATSRFLSAGEEPAVIISVINKAVADNLDFSWGLYSGPAADQRSENPD